MTNPAKSKSVIQSIPPLEISLMKDKSGLKIIWGDGEVTTISAVTLRENCRSAQTTKLKILNLHVPPSPDLTISEVRQVGSYGLNIIFSDGFDRGIYPWGYLHEISLNESLPHISSSEGNKLTDTKNHPA